MVGRELDLESLSYCYPHGSVLRVHDRKQLNRAAENLPPEVLTMSLVKRISKLEAVPELTQEDSAVLEFLKSIVREMSQNPFLPYAYRGIATCTVMHTIAVSTREGGTEVAYLVKHHEPNEPFESQRGYAIYFQDELLPADDHYPKSA